MTSSTKSIEILISSITLVFNSCKWIISLLVIIEFFSQVIFSSAKRLRGQSHQRLKCEIVVSPHNTIRTTPKNAMGSVVKERKIAKKMVEVDVNIPYTKNQYPIQIHKAII